MEIIKGGDICAPMGFVAAACPADIKGKQKGNLDLTLLLSDVPCQTAAVFTTNLVQAAPVQFDKALLGQNKEFIGIVVNSGNANACTGKIGIENCKKITEQITDSLDLPENSILAASTGVIGVQLPMDRIVNAIPSLCEDLDDANGHLFAKAIMTTDTVAKEIAVLVHTDEGSFVVAGACKGAGMIDPSMATLLSFITTDAEVDAEVLSIILKEACAESFNCITVDGDMSTNDSLFIFANGMSGVSVNKGENNKKFKDAVLYMCRELSYKLVKDGEGATKFVKIEVKGGRTKDEARLCAAKIANSPLVKTMFAGCDPNWGRLLSSAGASGAVFNPEEVAIWFNDVHYVKNGIIIDGSLEADVYKIMKTPEYSIIIDLGAGKESAVYYTCDLTKEYVGINADYRS